MKFSSILCVAALTAAALPALATLNPGNLPLWFEAGNASQFTAHGTGVQLGITATGADFSLKKTDGTSASARMTFANGNGQAAISGNRPLTGKISRFIGNSPAQWQSGIASFAQVRVENVYPSINAIYYGNQEKLEYDFEVAAGAKPEAIALRFDGAQKISINAQGELVIALNGGEVIQHRPIAYQTIAGERHSVAADYIVLDSSTVAFKIGNYDRAQALVIDPVLSFSTYFGGNSGETIWAMAVNPTDDSIYIAGQTISKLVTNGVPFTTANSYDTNFNGGTRTGDAFVAKFDSTGQNLLYCTYLGGSSDDAAYALAVNTDGHAFVAGATLSTNFPVLNPVTYGTFNGGHITGIKDKNINAYPNDGFITELSEDGSSLVYSTYFGGNKFDSIFAIAVAPSGEAFVTGYTSSTNFPTTEFALQNKMVCSNNFYINANAFVSEIAAGGNYLNYSTFLGGSNVDRGLAIAYNSGNLVVAGKTQSKNFPWIDGLTNSLYLNGRTNQLAVYDAFATKFVAIGTNLALQYSTFLGSTNEDVATSVAADADGNAYVVGWTTSSNFLTVNAITNLYSYVRTNRTGFSVATNAFLTKLVWNGDNAEAQFSQVFGGRGQDIANGVALDSARNIYVAGTVSSTNFPIATNFFDAYQTGYAIDLNNTNTVFPLHKKKPGNSDAFVIGFDASLTSVLGSAYIGGKNKDAAVGIAVDSADNIIIAGNTTSTNFPVSSVTNTLISADAYQKKRIGTNDTFIVKFPKFTPAF